jgi:hypothetical protein
MLRPEAKQEWPCILGNVYRTEGLDKPYVRIDKFMLNREELLYLHCSAANLTRIFNCSQCFLQAPSASVEDSAGLLIISAVYLPPKYSVTQEQLQDFYNNLPHHNLPQQPLLTILQ